MEAGHAHVVEPGDLVAHGLGGEGGLLGHRLVAGAAGAHHDGAQGGPGTGQGNAQPGVGVVFQVHTGLGEDVGLLPVHTGDEDVAAVPRPHGLHDAQDLLRRLGGPVDDLGGALADPTVEVHLGVAQVGEGLRLQLQQGVLRGGLSGRYGP